MSTTRRKRQQSELCRRLARLVRDGEVQALLLQAANAYSAAALREERLPEEPTSADVPDRTGEPQLAYD